MSEEQTTENAEPAKGKGGKKLLLLAVVAALAGGGGAFYGVYSGALPLPFLGGAERGGAGSHGAGGGTAHPAEPAAAFVPLEPLIISLGPTAKARHLKVTLTLEVMPDGEKPVEAALPRVRDVLNEFLRAVDEREFELPRAMARLRAQMLRRVLLVTPEGAVRDLLIQEFVLK